MRALLLVDVQNEFSAAGLRPVANHADALATISRHVADARQRRAPIAWIRHYNKPHESRAFVPGTWGAEFSPEMGPSGLHGPERAFEKEVYGAFGALGLDAWLRDNGVTEILALGFFAHMCLSTSVREALNHGYDVLVDPQATGAHDIEHPQLGRQSAGEVRRSALLHLVNMGARLFEHPRSDSAPPAVAAGPYVRLAVPQ